jgi:hypothetical protein
MTNSATSLQNVEGVLLVTLIVALILRFLFVRFQRSRPDFYIGLPLAVAFAIRLLAIAGISATGLGPVLRGGDETTFLNQATFIAKQPFGHAYLPHGLYQLQTVTFALQLKLGFLTQGAMRITQVGIALLGVLLILTSVYDLANGRAARLAAWLMAFEPASIFFNSALHKEPLMELATGLVVYGGTRIWLRLDVRGILLCALGGLIAIETRSYAGWFLVAAAVLILLHASIRSLDRPMRAMPLIYAVIIIGFIAAPAIIQASSKKNLQTLQVSQTANSSGESGLGQTGANSDNLALEQVNFSSRGAIISNLPKRVRDLILRPYPWQLSDTSQRFGALGTLIAYALLFFIIRYAWLARGRVIAHIGPLLYPTLFLLIAYSLSAGNAGTGFRYRTHLVTLGIALVAILREQAMVARAQSRAEAAAGRRRDAAGLRPRAPSLV